MTFIPSKDTVYLVEKPLRKGTLMKWLEVLIRVPEGSLLVRRPSGRKAILIEKLGPPQKLIVVRWLDDGSTERVNPADFDLLGPPKGTVERTE